MPRVATKVIKLVFSTSSSGDYGSESYDEYEANFDKEKAAQQNQEKKQDMAKKMLIARLIDDTAQDIERIAENAGNRYFSLSEDYLAENTMSLIDANINRGKKVAGDAFNGSLVGAQVGGAAGAVVGAIVGAVKGGVDIAIDIRNRKSQWYAGLNATNAQTEFSAARMGFIDGGRGTEN